MKTDNNASAQREYDVIIIGGGATGAGTARDCALRGLSVLLLERFDFTAGATGRNHGLLHSGARYAMTDGESAAECIKENMILKNIANHCVEDTSGLFVTLPEDDISYQAKFIDACNNVGIHAYPINPKDAIRMEPSVNKSIVGAVVVPDGSIDPFRLTTANILDATAHGATALTFHEVVGFEMSQNRVVGVKTLNHKNGERRSYYSKLVINAGGIWGHKIAQMAGVAVNMFPAKGALLVFGQRVNNVVINRCRKPADADILVPGDMICVIGTTSSRVPYEEIDNMNVTADEVATLLREGEKLAPSLASTRILRAYSGVRPLVAADNDPSGRNISRGIVLLDHAVRDGLEGFITITGGKLMTYRLMAEWATDLACRKLGVEVPCTTALRPLPGSTIAGQSEEAAETPVVESTTPANIQRAEVDRHGELAKRIARTNCYDHSLVCECENVTVGEVEYAFKELSADTLTALRRRTRVGMGTCQGELCSCRAAGLLSRAHGCSEKAKAELVNFLNERWKGIYPVAWGDSLRGAQLASWIYGSVCGLNTIKPTDKIAKK